LRIYDSKSYELVKSLKIEVDADPIAYDPANGHVFAVNGGDKAGHKYSHITVFDSVAERQIANIKVAGDEVEGLTVEANGPRLFANARALNQIAVINRETFEPMAIWPIKGAKLNTVAALDEQTHRLFVACHEGHLLVLDSDSGKQLQVLPIGQEADYIAFEPSSRKIFVSGGGGHGWVDVVKEDDGDHYHRLDEVTTEPGAATSHLVSSLGKYIVMAPSAENRPAQVLVYKITSEQ
jgi:DNA-binding beta-propeller fold protein YncE